MENELSATTLFNQLTLSSNAQTKRIFTSYIIIVIIYVVQCCERTATTTVARVYIRRNESKPEENSNDTYTTSYAKLLFSQKKQNIKEKHCEDIIRVEKILEKMF